jgi:hypothetical protein
MDVPSRGGEYSRQLERINRVWKILVEFRMFGEFEAVGKLFADCLFGEIGPPHFDIGHARTDNPGAGCEHLSQTGIQLSSRIAAIAGL